jgi:hypothetical protein
VGLDITAYSNLKPVGKHTDEAWCENEDHIYAFAYDSFPLSFRGIPVLGTDLVRRQRGLHRTGRRAGSPRRLPSPPWRLRASSPIRLGYLSGLDYRV